MYRFLAFLMIMSMFSCTEQPVPIPELIIPTTDKVVLIEDLTGVKCQNCPSGIRKLESLADTYGESIVVMSVHGRFLATPLSESKHDFRNDFSRELEDFLKPWQGKPSAVIDRTQFDDQEFFGLPDPDLWERYIIEELNKEQEVDLFLDVSINESTRELTVNVGASSRKDITGDFKISVAILESKIIDAQLDVDKTILDFEHNHVLRHMLTNFEGDGLTGSMTQDQLINRSYNYTIPPEENDLWKIENLDVIVFITNNEGDLKQVMQTAEAHVVE